MKETGICPLTWQDETKRFLGSIRFCFKIFVRFIFSEHISSHTLQCVTIIITDPTVNGHATVTGFHATRRLANVDALLAGKGATVKMVRDHHSYLKKEGGLLFVLGKQWASKYLSDRLIHIYMVVYLWNFACLPICLIATQKPLEL